jgi:DNA-binding CsgD family transcriptional regulator
MSSVATVPLPSRALRVFIVARNPTRHAHLRALALEAGHNIVDSAREVDVVLSDGECSPLEGRPVVTLSSAETDEAGSLNWEASATQIDAALRGVAAGLIVRSPGLALPGFAALDESALNTLLTPREVEVLKCIGEGLTNKLIARRLNISLHTVKFHIESLFRKLDATTRAQALARAVERRRAETIEF